MKKLKIKLFLNRTFNFTKKMTPSLFPFKRLL